MQTFPPIPHPRASGPAFSDGVLDAIARWAAQRRGIAVAVDKDDEGTTVCTIGVSAPWDPMDTRWLLLERDGPGLVLHAIEANAPVARGPDVPMLLAALAAVMPGAASDGAPEVLT